MATEGLDIRKADITTSVAQDGEVEATLGRVETGKGIARAVMYGAAPLLYQPNDPDGAGAAQAYYLIDGNTPIVIATRDNRYAALAGTLKPGDFAVVTGGSARVIGKKESDTIALYAENKKDDEQSMLVEVNGKDGTIVCQNGDTTLRMKSGGGTKEIAIAINGGASISMSGNTIEITAAIVKINGGSVSIGLNPGGVPPTPPLNSALIGPNGQVGVASTSVVIAL